MARNWASLFSVFGSRSRTAEARLRLVHAYKEVFQGSPSREDQQLVLADIRSKAGFDCVSPSDMTDSELRQQEGKRELYAITIHDKLTFSEADYQDLMNAARMETVAEQQQLDDL